MCSSNMSDDEKISSVHLSPGNVLSLQSLTLQQCKVACLSFQAVSHIMSKYCKQSYYYSISGSTKSAKHLKCGAKYCSFGMRLAALSQAFSNHMFTSLLLTLVGIATNPEEKPIKNKSCCIGYNICFSQKKRNLALFST